MSLSVAACQYRTPSAIPLGYEIYDQYCNDGLDNDGDGLVDCDDPECPFTSRWCGEALGAIPPVEEPEDTYTLCFDRVDNDRNGQLDCGDAKCRAIPETCCLREFTDELCSDGLDNDGNGFADCFDFGCSRGAYVRVCGDTEVVPPLTRAEACSDRFDADADGLVDCADPDCVGARFDDGGGCPTAPETTVERCSNRIDDDGDGNPDCTDDDCRSLATICLPRGAESTLELCFDGLDNDDNGFVDCDDFGCSRNGPDEVRERCGTAGGEPEDDLVTCFDGLDNDGNGFTDCNDVSCSRSASQEVLEACAATRENTFAKCKDGLDNDDNGFTDCEDFACSRPSQGDVDADPELATACDETGGLGQTVAFVRASCSDGRDNDGDGFVDCDDFDCNWNPLLRDPDGNDFCRASRPRLVCE